MPIFIDKDQRYWYVKNTILTKQHHMLNMYLLDHNIFVQTLKIKKTGICKKKCNCKALREIFLRLGDIFAI